MEKVSIIVPCYNGENFIDKNFNSIYNQDYSSIELILIDDGSVDASKETVFAWKNKLEERNIELKYYYQENQGLGAAINSGLKLVTGAYIILLDVDDEFLDGALSEKVKYLQENKNVNVVRSNGWIVKDNIKYPFVYDKKEKDNEDIFLALLRGETNNWAGSYMVRAKALFEFYPDREIYKSRYGQNLQFLLPLVYKNTCGFIDKPHMNYIQQGFSLSQTADSDEKESKSIENAKGYRDIRLHMVDAIISNEEKEYYIKNIQGAYWRGIMSIALMSNNKKILKEAYLEMQKYEMPTIDDKINYYSVVSKYKMYILRIRRKLRRIL